MTEKRRESWRHGRSHGCLSCCRHCLCGEADFDNLLHPDELAGILSSAEKNATQAVTAEADDVLRTRIKQLQGKETCGLIV